MSLFREEVREAQSAQWLGTVRLHRPPSFALVTGSAIAIALALVAFATWGDVNRKARLAGVLVPTQGSLNIAAPQAGVLMELPIVEGQTVQAGAVLMVLNTEHRSLHNGSVGDVSERVALQIEARRQTLATDRTLRDLQTRQRDQVLADRIHTLQAELRQSEGESSLQERRVQLAQTTLARNEQLAKEGFVAVAQVQAKQEELIDASARLQSLERARLGLQHDLQALHGERNDLDAQLQSDLNQIKRTEASLEQEAAENTSRKSTVITAPYSGTVTALGIQRGQSVQAGQNLVTLVRLGNANALSAPKPAQVEAHLFAPSFTAGFLRSGQTVYLRLAAYPYQKFGLHTGHITAVSETPFAPNELPPNLAQQLVAQSGSNEALYRVNVQLDTQEIQAFGEAIPLKAGLTVDADVIQERRKVWEWVFEPALAVRQQMKVLAAAPPANSQALRNQ